MEGLQIPIDMQVVGRERNVKDVAYVPSQNMKLIAVVLISLITWDKNC